MSDHTPSPATDGLRERLDRLAAASNEAELRWLLGEWITELHPAPPSETATTATTDVAGDGVGLRAELAEVMARINRPNLRESLIAAEAEGWESFAMELLASDWLAARVAEAGARALMEAADDDVHPVIADWLRDRARGLGGAS